MSEMKKPERKTANARNASVIAIALALTATWTAPVHATDGSFQNGIGAREKAIAGAGVADGTDATAISINPAGLVNAGNELDIAASALQARRGYTSQGVGGFVADGEHTSGNDWFALPNLAINKRVDWGIADAIAFSVYANGGINTSYSDVANSNCPPGRSGINCGGPLGLNLTQTFFSLGLAKQVQPGLSFGVAPILARQQFDLRGVGLFSGLSQDPAHYSDNGQVETWGGGVRAGVELQVVPGVKFGFAGATRISMGHMSAYSGALAEQGSLDIPASLQTGFTFQLRPDLKIHTDYRRIWFGSVAAIANPSTAAAPFGAPNGPGFGAHDLNVFKIGAEWQQSDKLILRAGYSYGTTMFRGNDADLNVLTGGAVNQHLTTGLKYKLSEKVDLELAGMYAPRTTLAGPELFNPGRTVQLNNRQLELTAGIIYRFDVTKPTADLK